MSTWVSTPDLWRSAGPPPALQTPAEVLSILLHLSGCFWKALVKSKSWGRFQIVNMHNALQLPCLQKSNTQNRNCHTEKQADKPVRTFGFFSLGLTSIPKKFVFIIADFIRFFNCFCRGLQVTLFHNYVLFYILDTSFLQAKIGLKCIFSNAFQSDL